MTCAGRCSPWMTGPSASTTGDDRLAAKTQENSTGKFNRDRDNPVNFHPSEHPCDISIIVISYLDVNRSAQVLQEIRGMRLDEAHTGRQARRLTQIEAARLLVVCTAEPATAFVQVSFAYKHLQNPAPTNRYHFIVARVRVHRNPDGHLVVLCGPLNLADFAPDGQCSHRRARQPHQREHGLRTSYRDDPGGRVVVMPITTATHFSARRGPSCGFGSESCGSARAPRHVRTRPWTTLTRRPHSRAFVVQPGRDI